MRQGPTYAQRFEYEPGEFGRPIITVPLEVVEDFENCECVRWTDNGDGTFTLKVYDLA